MLVNKKRELVFSWSHIIVFYTKYLFDDCKIL